MISYLLAQYSDHPNKTVGGKRRAAFTRAKIKGVVCLVYVERWDNPSFNSLNS
jgi:hypothetical protein